MDHHHAQTASDDSNGSGRVTDRVCSMKIDPLRAASSTERAGTPVYFCSKGCEAKFAANRDGYLRQPERPRQAEVRRLPKASLRRSRKSSVSTT
jgi:YHS domain-containing protein